MKITDETKVGILAVFGIVILILGYSFLKGKNLFTSKKYYYVVYHKIDGLGVSDPVTVNGYYIGKVASLQLLPHKGGKILVTLQIQQDIKVPENSTARLVNLDLLSEKAVEIRLGDSEEYAEDGDTLSGNVQASLTEEVGNQMIPLKDKAENLITSLDSVIGLIKVILASGKIEGAIDNISKATGEFAKVGKDVDQLIVTEREKISNILTNIEKLTAALGAGDSNVTKILSNLATITDSLSKVQFAELGASLTNAVGELNDLLYKVNSGQGSVGKLINDEEVYDSLLGAVENLEFLLADLQQNPKRYVHFSVFGRRGGKAASPPEDEEEPEEDTGDQ